MKVKKLIQRKTNKYLYNHVFTERQKIWTIKSCKALKKVSTKNLLTFYTQDKIAYNTLVFFLPINFNREKTKDNLSRYSLESGLSC